MQVTECLRRISNIVGTLDDITGKAANSLYTNQLVIDNLNTAVEEYARVTKGIQDVYSFPLNTNTPFVAAPTLALRSEAYHFLGYISRGTIFGMDMRNTPEVYNTFRYTPMSGIANWIMPWSNGKTQYLSIFPMGSTSPNATTLTADITAASTTITVASTTGFVNNHGRFTIGSEKILYGYKDSTHFYNCVRGVENTTAAVHSSTNALTENNVFLHYSRLPNQLTINSDDTVPTATSNTEIEVCEEHLIGIIKIVAYNMILKLDSERAIPYKIDSDKLFQEYKLEIMRGYYSGRQGTGVRSPFPTNESGMAYGANLIY